MKTSSTGVLMSIAGVTLLSPDVLVMRWIDLDHASILFWRGILLTCGFGVVILLRYHHRSLRALIELGWLGLASGLCFAINTTCYTLAIQRTSATATMMIISTAPVFAAILGWLALRERISAKTAIVIVATIGGIAIIAGDPGPDNSMTGNLFALGTAIFMAINFNLARMHRTRDIAPALIYGGIFTAAFALLGGASAARPETYQIGAMALTAAVSMPIGFTLLQIAPRYISATEVSLFLLLEAVLGPLWVWLALHEAPGPATLTGSALILLTLAYYGSPLPGPFGRSGPQCQ